MPLTKTIICLANSNKLGARCIAGVDIENGEWIRPVGSGNHGALTHPERTYDDGSEPALLDLIELSLDGPTPQPGQPEDWRIAPARWRKVGHLDDDSAMEWMEWLATDGPVFGRNTGSFMEWKVANEGVPSSLAVVRPNNLEWKKNAYGKVRCEFLHAGSAHDLPVTDPVWLDEFADDALDSAWRHSDDEIPFLVISLGEPYRGRHWKLVAGVIALPA